MRKAGSPPSMRGAAWRRGSMVVLSLVVLTVAAAPGMAVRAGRQEARQDDGRRVAGGEAGMPLACKRPVRSLAIADHLLANQYQLGPFPTVTLPADLTWRENPLGENNWLVRFHGLTWLWPLVWAWRQTGDERYVARVRTVIEDQLASNPRSDPASRWAWYDQVAGRRATVLACVRQELGAWPELDAGLRHHGEALADPRFYVGGGNHALDQAIGLLDVGHVLDDVAWVELARQRIGRLVSVSVSRGGVTNEQAVDYQYYNFRRYREAAARFSAYGLAPMPGLARVERMPTFLAHATLPNGQYEMIGDTEAMPAPIIAGTVAEFAATQGAAGPTPSSPLAIHDDEGWLFGRTGWGADRPFEDEVHYSLRFGAGPRFHGHHDLGSVTLYGYGSRLLLDSGKYSFDSSLMRSWITGRSAHNLVLVDGLDLARVPASLLSHRVTTRLVDTVVRVAASSGVTWERRVLFSRSMGYLVVEDRLVADVSRRFRQLWHLREDARPVVEGNRVWTRRPRGNVLIESVGGGTARVVKGSTSPRQGWLSYRYGSVVPAPVVEIHQEGTEAHFVTLLVPRAQKAAVTVSGATVTSDGFTFTVAHNGQVEQVSVIGDVADIVDGPAAPGAAARRGD